MGCTFKRCALWTYNPRTMILLLECYDSSRVMVFLTHSNNEMCGWNWDCSRSCRNQTRRQLRTQSRLCSSSQWCSLLRSKFRRGIILLSRNHWVGTMQSLKLQGAGAGNKLVTAPRFTAVFGSTRNVLVAVSACMLAASLGHTRNMLVDLFGSTYMLAAVSAKVGSAVNTSRSLAASGSATKWVSSAKGGFAAHSSSFATGGSMTKCGSSATFGSALRPIVVSCYWWLCDQIVLCSQMVLWFSCCWWLSGHRCH